MASSWIAQIDAWLRTNRPEYHAALRPGVRDRDIDAFEREFGLTLPPPARALFAWRDGQTRGNYANFVDNWMFPPLHDVADRKRMLDGMIGYDFEDPSWWRREWVPLFDNGGGDCLCIDLTEEGAGRVVVFWHDAADRPVESPGVGPWLRALCESMESGAYEVF